MYDVAIIGGGISGASLLYMLAKTNARVVLLERENDLSMGTTKANSAIVHAGYDPAPGTLMARYNVEGNALIHTLCAELDVPFKNTGSLVLALEENQQELLEALYARGVQNGVPQLRLLGRQELHTLEPSLAENALAALYAPSAGIVSPWELTLAMAQAAVEAEAEVRLDSEVTAIEKAAEGFLLQTAGGPVQARYVVNAAGVLADAVSQMAEPPHFGIHPTRGEYFLLDTTQGGLVHHIIFQCPSAAGKGVLVAPTVHGNLIVGPSADPANALSTATTREGLAGVRAAALKSVPGIRFGETIRNFAGLRAVADVDDFIVGESAFTPGFFNIAGIKSPGLTAAPAIARDIAARLLQKPGMPQGENPRFTGRRSVVRFKHLNAAQRARLVAQNPLYGKVVCRCQTVTEGEIVDALHRPLPPRSLDGVKRRCGPGMGRCQGGFCGPRVQAIIARELGIPLQDVPQEGAGSYIITGETKQNTPENT